MRGKFSKISALTLSLVAATQHAAHADATTEAQLRAALQQSTAQIATLEDQVANLQASQAPNVALIEALRAQLKNAAPGETPADKAKNDAAKAALAKQLAARNAELAKSQAAAAAAASTASTEAAQITALKTQLATTQAGLGSCDAKNAQLFTLGNQILDAYSHKDDVFGAFANHEPFIGFARVKLQNIVQDDQDKLYNDQVNPAGGAP